MALSELMETVYTPELLPEKQVVDNEIGNLFPFRSSKNTDLDFVV